MSAHAGDAGPPSPLRLTCVVLEGYAYLALILGIFLVTPAFLLWGVLTQRPFIAITALLIGAPASTTAARALRALWFAFPAPSGVDVGPNMGPRLHQEVHDIAKRVGAPRVHRIVVSQMNNASALQIARFGIFCPTNTVVIGYPLLAILSVDQIRAVIAHELGHLTHDHGRFASWVHRTRLSWVRLLQVLAQHQSLPLHVYTLFRFYVPRLHLSAAGVSRQQEFLADRLAAQVVGNQVAADTLMAIAIGQHIVKERFWPGIYTRIETEPRAPSPFAEMTLDLWDGIEDPEGLIGQLLEDDTAPTSTHPALRDRLNALKHSARWPDPVREAAADYYLGTQKPLVTTALDQQWQNDHGDEWIERHKTIRAQSERLSQLSALSSPTAMETLERGQLWEGQGDEDAALALYRAALEQGLPSAGLAAGRVLLDRDDESGIALIDAAMDADTTLVAAGCEIASAFLERQGRHVDAYRYQRRIASEATKSTMAQAERQRLSAADQLRRCEDPRIDVTALSMNLAKASGVQRAFLVTKEFRYSSGSQTVLAVVASNGAGFEPGLRREGLLPDDVSAVVIARHDQALDAALAAVPGALVFDGSARPRVI